MLKLRKADEMEFRLPNNFVNDAFDLQIDLNRFYSNLNLLKVNISKFHILSLHRKKHQVKQNYAFNGDIIDRVEEI